MWCRPALIDKSGMIACFDSIILHDLERLDVELCVRGSGGYWASMRIESNLMLQIKEAQRDDVEALWAIAQNALREKVMTEAHSSPFTIHPGSTKMYRDLKQYFWWNGMKQDVATFISMDLFTGLPTDSKDICDLVEQRSEVYSHFGKDTEKLVEPVLKYLGMNYLCLVEFSYNNSCPLASGITFELLYGKNVEPLFAWDEVVKTFAIQKVDIWDQGKLSLDSLVPFEILERIGEVSYRLALPPQLSHVHDIHPDMSFVREPLNPCWIARERSEKQNVIHFVKIL
ncbi:retrotransposon protein, putative, ty3-gypsy subclass [Tanacetum coccineum]